MAQSPIGDLVRLVDDERLDIVDAKRLQVFVYEALADAVGGLMGECSGVCGDVVFGTSPLTAISIGECMLAGFRRRPGSQRRVRGGIFHYDPSSTYQAGSTTVNLLGYVGQAPFLWFARTEEKADIESRRAWGAGVETSITPETTFRQRFIFGKSLSRDTPPSSEHDWFVFAQVIGWSGNVPTIEPISVFDIGIDPNVPDKSRFYPGRVVREINKLNAGSTGTPELNGLPRVLTYLAQVLAATRSSGVEAGLGGETLSDDGDLPWTIAPERVLPTQLSTAGLSGISELTATMSRLIRQPLVICWGKVTVTGGVPDFTGLTHHLAPSDANIDVSTGVYQIAVKAPGGVTHCHVTPIVQVSHTRIAGYDVIAGSTSEQRYIVVRIFDEDGASEDCGFSLTVFGWLE